MITILVEGRGAFVTGVEQLMRRFQNYRKTLEKVGDDTFVVIQKRFVSGGPGWPALARSTEARKAKRLHGPSRILIDTGEMKQSFTRGGQRGIFRLSNLEGEYGSSDPKAMFHQEGGGRLPQRMILDVTERDELRYERILIDDLTEDIEALGFDVN